MRFVLEEASWAWDGSDPGAYIERIELLLDRLDTARERDELYAASSELLQQTVFEKHTLADLLWSVDSPLCLPHEVQERIVALFGSLRYWDHEAPWPAIEVTIDGRRVLSPSAALAHARIAKRVATACLALPGTWSGPRDVVIGDVKQPVHFVVNEPTHRTFFRDALEVERSNEAGLAALAPHAFPGLFFVSGVFDGVRHFDGGYARVRQDLHHVLAVLDDYGAWVFTDETGRLSPNEASKDGELGASRHAEGTRPTPTFDRMPVTRQLVQRRFTQWGLDIAPENPDVRADGFCRRARERDIEGETLYCEWHCKLDPHVNRVHIHPPVAVSGGKVVVAIFRDHLPLPRDG